MPASKRTSFISSANCRLSPLPYEVSGSTPNASAFCMVCRHQLGSNRPFVGCVPTLVWGITPDKFECIGRRRSAWCTKAELSDRADSETPRRLPHATYVLHRAGCSQEDDQLLRER